MQGVKLCQVWDDQCTGRGSALQIWWLFHLAFACPVEWSYWRGLYMERLVNSYPRQLFNSLLYFSSVDVQCVTKAFGVTVTLQVNPVKPFSWQFGTRGPVHGSLAASEQGQSAGLWHDPWVTDWVCHPLHPSDIQVPGHLFPLRSVFFHWPFCKHKDIPISISLMASCTCFTGTFDLSSCSVIFLLFRLLIRAVMNRQIFKRN